jgi:hypothetical protein
MIDSSKHRAHSGRTPTDENLETRATEVAEKDYDLDVLKTRRCGRPPTGSGMADVVPVILTRSFLAAIEAGRRPNTPTQVRSIARSIVDSSMSPG